MNAGSNLYTKPLPGGGVDFLACSGVLNITPVADGEGCVPATRLSSPASSPAVGVSKVAMQAMQSIGNLDLTYLIGREIGTCTLLKELARGNMAVLFVAYQRTLKRQIAAKILPRSVLTRFAAERFREEAESAAILSHPNIVTVYEAGETKEFLYILLQLVRGQSLAERLRLIKNHVLPSRRILPIEATLKIVVDVLGALDYAHRHDIVHRDVKPANILLEIDTDRPFITDFGLAMPIRGSQQEVGAGTPIYMAPEQMWRGLVDGRADIYATGMMLYEMLVPTLPVPSALTSEELLRFKFQVRQRLLRPRPSQVNPLLHWEMDEILLKALSFDPAKRYPSCEDFLDALKGYQIRHLR
jgi:serine/threonine protein kinase